MTHNVQIVEVTPALAKQWLVRNTRNRSPMQRGKTGVESHIRRLKNGTFRDCVGEIRIAEDHVLQDGQKRLMAIAETGISARMIVHTGCPVEDYTVVDGGQSRSSSDDLTSLGFSNGQRYGGALRAYLTTMAAIKNNSAWLASGGVIVERSDVIALAQRLPHAVSLQVTSLVSLSAKQRKPAPTAIAAFFIIANHIAPTHAQIFFEQLLNQSWIEHDSPVKALSLALVNLPREGGAITQTKVMFLCMRAFDAFINKKPLALCRFVKGQSRLYLPKIVCD